MNLAYIIWILWAIFYYSTSKLAKSGLNYSTLTLLYIPVNIIIIFIGLYNKSIQNDLLNFNTTIIKWYIIYMISGLFAGWIVYNSVKTIDPFLIAILELLYPLGILIIQLINNETKINYQVLLGSILALFGIALVLSNESR